MPRRIQRSTANKPAPLAPLADPASLAARFKDFPAIAVLERRFENPADPGSLPILLKDESPDCCVNSDHQTKLKPGATTCKLCDRPARKWFVYWVNTAKEGRWAQIKAKGYVAVEVKELADAQDVADLVKQQEESGAILVRRGDRGQEILCKQPLEAWLYIKALARNQAKAKANSAKARREARAEAAGQGLGDQAGQEIYDGAIKEEYHRTSRTTLEEEAEELAD